MLKIYYINNWTSNYKDNPFDRGHFIIWIDGTILDSKYSKFSTFGSFFSKLEITVERKNSTVLASGSIDLTNLNNNLNSITLNSNFVDVNDNQNEIKAKEGENKSKDKNILSAHGVHYYQIKVYFDKVSDKSLYTARLKLTRSNNILVRYELSPSLRSILPNLRVDPSEEEVILALWHYIRINGLFGDKDRKFVKTNEVLLVIFVSILSWNYYTTLINRV